MSERDSDSDERIVLGDSWKSLSVSLSQEQYAKFMRAITLVIEGGNYTTLSHDLSSALYDMKYLIMDSWINVGFCGYPSDDELFENPTLDKSDDDSL